MSDCYRLEWIHSMQTIQTGIGESLQRDTFQDTMVICRDGMTRHNKLTLGLLLPELAAVSVFCLPVDHTILLPDYSLAELHSRIAEMFPVVELSPRIDSVKEELEINMNDNNFEHFLDSPGSGPGLDTSPRTYGMRRGRGRPPLANTARLPPRFQCDFCNKGFFYRSMLTAHEKLHTGGSRETCDLCGAEYSTRQNLKNHMIKHHGEDSFTPRKRGRPPLDPAARKVVAGPSPGRGYRGRGRPPLAGRRGGPAHPHYLPSIGQPDPGPAYTDLSTFQQGQSEELSTESFLEQNMEDGQSDEERRQQQQVEQAGLPNSHPPAPLGSSAQQDIMIDDKEEPDIKDNIIVEMPPVLAPATGGVPPPVASLPTTPPLSVPQPASYNHFARGGTEPGRVAGGMSWTDAVDWGTGAEASTDYSRGGGAGSGQQGGEQEYQVQTSFM